MYSKDNLAGLILAGGKSRRMGIDKSTLSYHPTTLHRRYLYHILVQFCKTVYISCRSDQQHLLDDDLPYILDRNLCRGPLNGLLSAHHDYPENAWVVLAVDLPHINPQTVQALIRNRNPEKFATAYATRAEGLPEPLVAIWEHHGLSQVKGMMKKGKGSCPRKLLMQSDTQLVFPEDELMLFNANFPADYETAKNRISLC